LKILMRLLEESGALRRGHFLLSSGLHSEAYVQCALLLEDPVRARQVGEELAAELRSFHPDSVLAPALGGVIIGHEVAAALGVPFRFSERKGEEMGLRRGFTLRQGERVVIVEDVVTTGRSTLETAALATGRGARVVAIGAIIDRTVGRDPFDVPFRALLPLDLPSYTPGECPVCRAGGHPPEKPGSRPEAAAGTIDGDAGAEPSESAGPGNSPGSSEASRRA
jgi:orotate phosphoribosyltransferase